MFWHWSDLKGGQHKGTAQEFKTMFDQKLVTKGCYCYNSLTPKPKWIPIKNDPEAMAFLKPPKPKAPMTEKEQWVQKSTPHGRPFYYNTVTKLKSWNMPKCLEPTVELDKGGEWVWMPHKEMAYVPAKVLERDATKAVLQTEDGDKHKYALTGKGSKPLHPLSHDANDRLVRDLVQLDDMTEPLLLHMLKKTFMQNEIYTCIGTILISVNPYKALPLYTPSMMDDYRNHGDKDMPPHIFAIADRAFNSLTEHNMRQSIVISGESGAGKTECTKQCLQYLAEVAGSSSNVEQKILQANPLLEAFGNAKTLRNNNSSRFGKYVQIFFNEYWEISGAYITNYLLEKSRVTTQTGDERNYHIFYQLCAGFSDEQRERFGVKGADTYHYLNQSGNTTIAGVDDVADFAEMEDAVRLLELSDEEMDAVYQVVCGVLHLGNIEFKPTSEGEGCKVRSHSKVALAEVVRLFGVTKESLTKAVTQRTITMKGDPTPIDIPLSVDKASAARDALAKFTYAQLFDWLVQRVNRSIGRGEEGRQGSSIGILDIFGFEIFETNSFEQLCINFANEKLQQYFNANTFKQEEVVYKQEEVPYVHIDFTDNQPIVRLIANKPDGLLPSLDEEGRLPRATDETFVQKVTRKHADGEYFRPALRSKNNFLLNHYAGEVEYCADGFLDKNSDQLLVDIAKCVQGSKLPFLAGLFPGVDESSKAKKAATLAGKFCSQLDDLMVTLQATEPHYVRCIKPNEDKKPMAFDPNMVLQQLRYSGVFEAVKIRKMGYPFRFSHADFARRFRCLAPLDRQWANDVAACEDLLETMGVRKNVQVGKSRVLYKAEQRAVMEKQRSVALEKTCIFLQRVIRGWQARVLRKRLELLRPKLQAAIKAGSLDACNEALAEAAEMSFNLKEVRELKKIRASLARQDKLRRKIVEVLAHADPVAAAHELERASDQASELGDETIAKAGGDLPDLVKQLRARLAEVPLRRKVRATLVEAADEMDAERLGWALGKVAGLKGMAEQCSEEVANAKQMQERLSKEKEMVRRLPTLLATGGYLKAGDKVDAAPLLQLAEEMQAYQMHTEEGVEALHKAKVLSSLRKHMEAALAAGGADEWAKVERAVRKAGDELAELPEVLAAVAAVVGMGEQAAATSDLEQGLRTAMEARDVDDLRYLVSQAQERGMRDSPLVAEARAQLKQLVKCTKMLAGAIKSMDQLKLEMAVFECERTQYRPERFEECRKLRDTVMNLHAEAAYAVRMLEPEKMKDVVTRARKVKFKSPEVSKLAELLLLPPLKLVHQQLKAAVAESDQNRVVRLTIEEKELFLKDPATLDMYELPNFAKLRQPEAWAAMKKTSWKKTKLATKFFKFSRRAIHASLTEQSNAKDNKLAVRMYKNVVGFMGDRSYNLPGTLLAQELTKNCLEQPWLRDEIYVQLIKQLTKNPKVESRRKGFELMAMCLATFPASTEFGTFLYVWLRTIAEIPKNAPTQQRLLALLHATEFAHKPRTTPYDESELTSIAEGKTGGRRYWVNFRDYEVPKPVPLLSSSGQRLQKEPMLECMYSYQAQRKNQLGFKKGEKLVLLSDNQEGRRGWWKAKNSKGEVGLVAVNYVKKVEQEDFAAQMAVTKTPRAPNKTVARTPQAQAQAQAAAVSAGSREGSLSKQSAAVGAPPAAAAAAAAAAAVAAAPELKCLYRYVATAKNQLSFEKGDTLTLVSDIEKGRPGWWLARNSNGNRGLIPKNYVKKVEGGNAQLLTHMRSSLSSAGGVRGPNLLGVPGQNADSVMRALVAAVEANDPAIILSALTAAERLPPNPDRTKTIGMVKDYLRTMK